jgi:hypothetical protein
MTPISLTTTEDIDGEVKLNPSWEGLSGIARLDLLQDWIGVLTQLYSLTHHDVFRGGHEYNTACMQAIKGWEFHGKSLDDYTPALLNLAPQGEA